MPKSPTPPPDEQPYPLRRLFRRRFIPAFVGFLGLLLVLVGFTADAITESIYLGLAERRAETIGRAVSIAAPEAWAKLMEGRSALDLDKPDEAIKLTNAFNDEVDEELLTDLKVYDMQGRVMYAVELEKIGTSEEGAPLHMVIDEGEAALRSTTAADGSAQYEFYVPFHDEAGNMRAVFELYEPDDYLNGLLLRAAIPALVVPGILLIILAFALDRMVGAAQREIDARTNTLIKLRHRLETFLSQSAVTAARRAGGEAPIVSREIVTTLLYSDIRGFTEFAEANAAEEVVTFLNDIMSAQVAVITAHGGDVDKLIGDAILAHFHGSGDARRAIAAGQEILTSIARNGYPRGLGIGVYRGKVIQGSIGPEQRRDFTVIGDSVNISARLCALAGEGELVADAAVADDTFGAAETIQVRGRHEPLMIRRWKAPAP